MKTYSQKFYNITLKTSENYIPCYESKTDWEVIYSKYGISFERAKEFSKPLLKKELERLKYNVLDYDTWWAKEIIKQEDNKDFSLRIGKLSLSIHESIHEYDF